MVKRFAIPLSLIITLLVVVSTPVAGSPYNFTTDSTKIYNTQWCIPFITLTAPLDPKVSCDTTGSNCIALAYDTCVSNGVRAIWSVDKFQSTPVPADVIVNMGGAIPSASFLDKYEEDGGSLYYDVEYFQINADLGAFYMVFGTDVYVAFTSDPDGAGVGLPLPTVYTPSAPLVAGSQTYGHSFSIDCATETGYTGVGTPPYSCVGAKPTYAYGFQDGNATNLWGVQLCQARSQPTYDWDGLFCTFSYDVTNTTADTLSMAIIDSTVSCSAGGSQGIDYMSVQGAYWTGTGPWRYRINATVDYCVGTLNDNFIVDNLASPQNYWNQRFFGGNLYYRNTTGNVSGFIFSSSTPDLVSFGSPVLQYTEDSAYNETINQSDSAVAGNTNVLVWERKTNGSDESNNGIWAQRQNNFPITVTSDVEAPTSVNLWCNDTGVDYSDSGSGQSFILNTICANNNRLIFTGSNRPLSHTDWVDIPSECLTDGFDIGVKYAQTPVNHTITVRDISNNLPLPNVNVTIDGTTKTTDSSGQTWFDLQQLSGSTLDRVNVSNCSLAYSTDGTAITKTVTADRVGYLDASEIIPAPIKSVVGNFNVWTLDDSTDIYMQESGMFWTLNIKASGGVEIEPCRYNVTLTGANVTWVVDLTGVERLGTETDEFPATFKFNHSSSPVNVTATLQVPDGSTYNLTESFVYDEIDSDTFFISYNVDTLPCRNPSPCTYIDSSVHYDCPSSLCIGEYHYKAKTSQCDSDQTCSYDAVSCFLPEFCDSLIGCFDTDTTISCLQDTDCTNSCANANTLIWGRCGADGLCKNLTYACTTGCNSSANLTEPFCNELVNCELGDVFNAKVSYFNGTGQFPLIEGTVTCDIDNVGERVCLRIPAIPKAQLTSLGITVDDLYVTPSDWIFVETADHYNWSAITVECNDTCDAVYTVCDGECDTLTGECIEGSTLRRSLQSTLPVWLQFIISATFLWSMLALIVGAVLTFLPSKVSQNAQPTPEIGLAGMFVWFIIGLAFQFVDPLIGLLIVIGLGLGLARTLTNVFG